MRGVWASALALLLLGVLVLGVQAQSAPVSQGEDGVLRIRFAPGTTLTETNQLRLHYGLTLYDYEDEGGRSYRYQPADDRGYVRFARAFYYNTPCMVVPTAGYATCPPITPTSASYASVSAEIATALQADGRVEQMSNRQASSFFLAQALCDLIARMWSPWRAALIGPAESN